MLKLYMTGLDDASQALILEMFNDTWLYEPGRHAQWVHWRAPKCCESDEECVRKAREALRRLLQHFPAVPLLYRWKHWEPALFFAIRGTMLNGVLQFALYQCASSQNIAKMADLDPDNPDLSLSLKQEVRLCKAVKFMTSENIKAATGFVSRQTRFSGQFLFFY